MTDCSSLSKLRGQLDALCKKYGNNSPLGSRYSMLCQLAGAYPTADTRRQREAIDAAIERATKAIVQIKADGGYIEANHIAIERTRVGTDRCEEECTP